MQSISKWLSSGDTINIDTDFVNRNMTNNKVYLIFIIPDYTGSAYGFYTFYTASERKLAEVQRFQCILIYNTSTQKLELKNTGNSQTFKIRIYSVI